MDFLLHICPRVISIDVVSDSSDGLVDPTISSWTLSLALSPNSGNKFIIAQESEELRKTFCSCPPLPFNLDC